MIVGLPPHYNENKIKMYQDIRKKPAKVPAIFCSEVRDLIESLLRIEPEKRLGAINGIEEIKSHSFFKEINWVALKDRKLQSFMKRAPISVDINSSNFDSKYTDLPIEVEVQNEKLHQKFLKK